ncbi:hypothetical protein D3C76_1747540 [compost metagenome]
MFVFIQRPIVHHGQRALEVTAQKIADREFSRAECGEVFERSHGRLESMGAVSCDVMRQRDADEAAVQARGEGAQYLQRLIKTQRQYGVQ